MKYCPKCKLDKEVKEFHNNKGMKDGKARICKPCSLNEGKNSNYRISGQRNKDIVLRRRRLKLEFDDYVKTLNLECRDCGEKHPSTLDFHHLDPSTKKNNIAILKWAGTSKKTLLDEVGKCIVLCSNCHRKLHYNERMVGGETGRRNAP